MRIIWDVVFSFGNAEAGKGSHFVILERLVGYFTGYDQFCFHRVFTGLFEFTGFSQVFYQACLNHEDSTRCHPGCWAPYQACILYNRANYSLI